MGVGSGGRCIYHRRRVSGVEAIEKCIPRHCKYFQDARKRIKAKMKELDRLFERR